jgi:hypothetical protein
MCENLAAFCLLPLDIFALVLGTFAISGYALASGHGGYDDGKLHDALVCYLIYDISYHNTTNLNDKEFSSTFITSFSYHIYPPCSSCTKNLVELKPKLLALVAQVRQLWRKTTPPSSPLQPRLNKVHKGKNRWEAAAVLPS